MNESVFNTFPNLQSKRLFFKELSTADVNDILELRSNKQTNQFMDRDLAQSIDDAVAHVEKVQLAFAEHSGISWALFEKTEMKFIGDIAIWKITRQNNRGEIGYALNPQYWGKGLMKEAIDVVTKFSFSQLQIHSIEANVNPKNLSSIKVLEKCNFKREAYFRQNYFYNGQYLDSVIYSLLEEDI